MPITCIKGHSGLVSAACRKFAVSFSAVKSASAAIAYFQRINLYSHNPTMGQLASFVRNAVMRRLGLAPRSRKTPFTWDDILRFARARLSSENPPYCYLVVVTLCAVSFGGVCRFSDAVHFGSAPSCSILVRIRLHCRSFDARMTNIGKAAGLLFHPRGMPVAVRSHCSDSYVLGQGQPRWTWCFKALMVPW